MADRVFPVFMGTWIVLAVAGFYFFPARRDVRSKRKWWPWWIALVSVLFIGFVAATGFSTGVLAFMIPVTVMIGLLNLRNTRFCGTCGRMITEPFTRPKYCSKCGGDLDADPIRQP
jgi:hypothetical protein